MRSEHTTTVASRSFLHAVADAARDGYKSKPGVISAERISLTIQKEQHSVLVVCCNLSKLKRWQVCAVLVIKQQMTAV